MRSILGIDTASADGSGALWIDGQVAGSFPLRPGEHSSGLSTAVASLLEARSLSLRGLAAVAVARGPGSFTGLRIGLAWAKGVALAAETPLALISSHEATARAQRARGGLVATLLPGERGEVEVALWECGAAVMLRFGPEPVPESDWLERLEAAAGGAPFALRASLPSGAAGHTLAESIREEAEDAGIALLPAVPLAPSVAELGALALESGALADPIGASPDYGRAPNARKPVR
jgi:tRNA threonylcarbamoyladenosine biosynthesis protein TsaB